MEPAGWQMDSEDAVVRQQPGPLSFSGVQQAGPLSFSGGRVAPGLERLAPLDRLLVQQQLEMFEVFTGWETNNRYTVRTAEDAEPLFRAVERTSCWLRWCCGRLRPFRLRVLDAQQRDVLQLSRPLRCQGCCCACCQQRLEVYADGQLVGEVREQSSCLRPRLTVHRPAGEHVLTVSGPLCPSACCGDVQFAIQSADGTQQVGSITKRWGGLVKEVLTDADTLEVSFPVNLETSLKAALLGALFLIDFMFFERKR